jgi:formylglycine-generating enzyme required for sulfatase activity
MKIFISYRRAEDKKTNIVGNIHKHLVDVFVPENVFLDTYDIHGGDPWRSVLENALSECTVMLVIIGPDWVNLAYPNGEKRLFDPTDVTRREIETGLERIKQQKTTVIPVLIMNAEIPKAEELPESLRPLLDNNVVNIRNYPDFDHDMEKLLLDIRGSQGYAINDIKREDYEPQTVYISKGCFWMGSELGEDIPFYETPEHEVNLPAYRIGISPVTNSQYEVFIQETGTRVMSIMNWVGQRVRQDRDDFPVIGITFYEALAYCKWLSQKTARKYAIPNEAQWEKACRANNKRIYPWGSELEAERSNHGQATLAPANAYPAQNEFGLLDLVGNVRQWTVTLWGENRVTPDPKLGYPWKNDRRNDQNASRQIHRVIRGSSFAEEARTLRCCNRSGQLPTDAGWIGAGIGFRVAMNI